ncbi:hemerythrin HHE cation-binding protein [Methanosarcina sp. DH2]|uniref:hemerythrin domain-containing protein n=1 Tax=Methanosarcina sp. DH2 TaxID=2605639 RepID=UPI001E4E030C|nr:hemerythrin domain-containing protein [Methanosarcina sp. DH2]MCC4770921.1 hemerythrin HHE cation-binding protein [Methanosarcina sp. DH2]
MKPTDDLREEHRAVKLMLKILDSICTSIESGRSVKQEHLEGLVEFMKVFVDKCHHTKEEAYLFPEMEKAEIPGASELITSLKKEHEQGREYVRRIGEAVSKKVWDRAGSPMIEDSQAYIRLLTQHTDKEDNNLFPMADAHFEVEVQKELLDSFEIVENEEIGAGKHEEFHMLLHGLRDRYVEPE